MFITNTEKTKTLNQRLQKLTDISEELKFLTGFFYFSGWDKLYEGLTKNKNARLKILVGLEVSRYLSRIIEMENNDETLSANEHFNNFIKSLDAGLNNATIDNKKFYDRIDFFINMLSDNRLIIKKTLNPNHSKLYLFKYNHKFQNSLDKKGAFITGSSNLTKAGISEQEEFNIEISDYGFNKAEEYFDNLWEQAIPITEDKTQKKIIIDFLENKTQTARVTPYEAYAYILQTFIQLHQTKKIDPFLERLLKKTEFKKYSYQLDAVNQALNIIDQYNGVIIADVVGLGKSVIACLIAKQLGKRGLIICPPLIMGDQESNTGWHQYKKAFKLDDWDIKSVGKIEDLAESIQNNSFDYEVIILDEAHRFRNRDTASYSALEDITKNRKVILLTATPFNNSPSDIYSLLKLFIIPGRSGITLEQDIRASFDADSYKFKIISYILKNYKSQNVVKRKNAEQHYERLFKLKPPVNTKLVKERLRFMANEIKRKITPIVIRRNRIDLTTDFQYKKEIKELSEPQDPKELFYRLKKEQSEFYDTIIYDYFGENGEFKGAIYRPFEYETATKAQKDREENRAYVQQKNLFDFMRRLLVKRFESSFGAFEKSIERFLKTHKIVKAFIKKSGVYILDRKAINVIYNDDENAEEFTAQAIKEALEEFKKKGETKKSPKHTRVYTIENFRRKIEFLQDIDNDIALFEKIKENIKKLNLVNSDPKRKNVFEAVQQVLNKKENPKRKIIIYTEYADTVLHLQDYFTQKLNNRALICAGGAISKKFMKDLDANFNARHSAPKDDYDILITTDKLSEGFNLNRAGLVINYDIPWNPTRVIQRLGRINRIGAKVFKKLYIYNFFPTEQGADFVKSKEIASEKMFLIHNALGEDAKIFEADEILTASKMFKKLNSKPDDKKELSLLTIIRNEYQKIKTERPEVIEKIKKLPARIKTAKNFKTDNIIVLRKKGLALFTVKAEHKNGKYNIKEIPFDDFFTFAKADYKTKRVELSEKFWEAYENIKTYKPKYRSGSSDNSLDAKALNSLKSLLKNKPEELTPELASFVNTLLKDIKHYKTLSEYKLRNFILQNDKDKYKKLIQNIKDAQRRIGADYLDIILKKSASLKEEIIVSVENKKEIL
ncbi:MAG: DEAD/DEAH box helicase family protein [Deltaproteobacteria bacterium]|nr:DEAD/DEAH box helicase family protein [Deltaproteobacteria bacterium]